MGTPWSWLGGILEEEESSVKDLVTSGILLRPPIPSTEASGSGEPLIPSSKVYAHGGEDTVIKTKMAPAANKTEEKRGLSMGHMVSSGWQSKGYSVPVEESVSLVGKSTGTLEATSGSFVPQSAGVGQMKLEAPPRYSGKRQPGAQVWLTQMERYMKLMRYAPTNWLDVVAMRVEGAVSSWVNAVL